MSVTHLVGPGVTIGGRGIQRCMICGEKLIDTLGMMVPEGSGPIPAWQEGRYVTADGESPQVWVFRDDINFPEDVPDDLCLALVER